MMARKSHVPNKEVDGTFVGVSSCSICVSSFFCFLPCEDDDDDDLDLECQPT